MECWCCDGGGIPLTARAGVLWCKWCWEGRHGTWEEPRDLFMAEVVCKGKKCGMVQEVTAIRSTMEKIMRRLSKGKCPRCKGARTAEVLMVGIATGLSKKPTVRTIMATVLEDDKPLPLPAEEYR